MSYIEYIFIHSSRDIYFLAAANYLWNIPIKTSLNLHARVWFTRSSRRIFFSAIDKLAKSLLQYRGRRSLGPRRSQLHFNRARRRSLALDRPGSVHMGQGRGRRRGGTRGPLGLESSLWTDVHCALTGGSSKYFTLRICASHSVRAQWLWTERVLEYLYTAFLGP